MSNVSPILNGENTGGVSDFTTDASVNMVAAIHDHISCTKPVQVDPFANQDTKTGILSFSCEFDHMYASLTDSTGLEKETLEVKHLKDLLLLHLDLIQQQSEQLVTKDKQISALKQENETLRQRLERMDRRVNLQKHREGSSSTSATTPVETNFNLTSSHASVPCVDLLHSRILSPTPASALPGTPFNIQNSHPPPPSLTATSLPETVSTASATVEASQNVSCSTLDPNKICRETWTGSSNEIVANGKRRRREVLSTHLHSASEYVISANSDKERQRLTSWSSSVASDTGGTLISRTHKGSVKRSRGVRRKIRNKGISATSKSKEPASVLTTDFQYFTHMGELPPALRMSEESEISGNVEVPSWRSKVYTSCYTMEGTEDLNDEVFNKRHQRFEIDERRRKRWDVQRIREQRHVEKLRQRETTCRSGRGGRRRSTSSKSNNFGNEEPVSSLFPHVDDMLFLEVTNELPVSAFGAPITKFSLSEFSLPWLSESALPVTPRNSRQCTSAHNKKGHLSDIKR